MKREDYEIIVRIFSQACELTSHRRASFLDAACAEHPHLRTEIEAMLAADVLSGLDQIAGLREAAARLAGGDSPERLASAIEFLLEGLHLSNRLNKDERESGTLYTSA